MATRKSVDQRRKIAGKILHTSPAEGKKEADEYNELLKDAKKLAGSILSSKEPRRGIGAFLFGR